MVKYWVKRIAFIFVSCVSISLSVPGQNHSVNWQSMYTDSIVGTDAERALGWLEQHRRRSGEPIIVGVIDSGTDTTHAYLRPSLWVNPKELPDGKDNDGNGYIDDIHGWNFLGGRNEPFNVVESGLEEFREFRRLYPKYKEYPADSVSPQFDTPEYRYYREMMKNSGYDKYLLMSDRIPAVLSSYLYLDSMVRIKYADYALLTIDEVLKTDGIGKEFKEAVKTVSNDLRTMRFTGNWQEWVSRVKSESKAMQKMKINLESGIGLREQIGDDMNNADDRFYGNTDLMGGSYDHGAFVGGVIAAKKNEGNGMKGIYPAARIMAIRAIPDGDEYDKDVASAIYYAVDNGAKVVNMSFGKMVSPQKEMVEDALRYAAAHDVLLIQASGNNGIDRDKNLFYPYGTDEKGVRLGNLLCVGASDINGNPCGFSNYGKKTVDVFAPGSRIYSVAPHNNYVSSSGTSVASPVVAGIAAMIRDYYPKLTAEQVRDILMQSVVPVTHSVVMPGTKNEKTTYSELCVSGGVVNAMRAVKLAEEISKRKKR